mmetsp:Transcript_9278/g.17535  ORF Transcript_9278/g.17535 Transcript_9278/m.17535 type:complete len:203 (+) Transcript_9278:403-1011(+)
MKPAVSRSLTHEGQIQALKAGVALRHIIGDESVIFFVSPYKSCKQTFQYVGGSFPNLDSCQYLEDPRLRNIHRGDLYPTEAAEKLKTFKEEAGSVGKFYYKWPDNGESVADVYDRISSFMESLYRKFKYADRPDNFVIISHDVVLKTFLMKWMKWDAATFERLKKFKNGQIAVMEKQDDGSYMLITPLPCEAPIPKGVKTIS